MRIPTFQANEEAVARLQQRQQGLADAQQRLASGLRVQRASDDPVAAARGERALAATQRAEVSMRALEAARNTAVQAESALGDATGLLHAAREALVAAGNGSFGDGDRAIVAGQLQQLRDQLLGVANRQDGAGRHLFAGQGSDGAPFRDRPLPAGVEFTGTAGEPQAATGEGLLGAVDGREAWMGAPGAGSVFDALDRAIEALRQPGGGPQGAAQTVSAGLRGLDEGLDRMLSVRARLGATLQRLDGLEERLGAQQLHAQAERSEAVDLDLLQALSELQQKQSGHEAALRGYAQTSKLSLFQFIA